MAENIPREFIQVLLSRIDIVDLIDGRIPLRKKSNNNYFACCPFHTEKSASFSVCQNKQFYYCFGCGAHGNAIDFLMQYDRLSFPEAIETLAKHAGIAVPRQSQGTVKTAGSVHSYELLQQVAQFYQAELRKAPKAIEYLKQRGVSGEIAKTFAIGFAPSGWDHVLQAFGTTPSQRGLLLETGMVIKKDEGGHYDRFRDRIMFPIMDRRGRVIGFGGRVLDKGEPKYLNSPETPIFQKGQTLYGLYQNLQTHHALDRIVMVEGYMDVIALYQHGIHYAVASLGTAATTYHLQQVFKHTAEIIFCFDGDDAGRLAAWRALLIALPILRDDLQIRFMFLPQGDDPDTYIRKNGKASFEESMKNALALSHFFFQTLASQADLSHVDGRARFVKLASEHLKELPEGVFQKMMWEELAKRARMDKLPGRPSATAAQQTQHTRTGGQAAHRPSMLRQAIMFLVQDPLLANRVSESLPSCDIPGFSFFIQLVEMIKLHSIQSTAVLLEYWREQKEATLLAKLANLQHAVPIDGIENEFLGALSHLKKLANQQSIEKLLAKAAQEDLSIDEKKQLQELFYAK